MRHATIGRFPVQASLAGSLLSSYSFVAPTVVLLVSLLIANTSFIIVFHYHPISMQGKVNIDHLLFYSKC